MIDNFQQPENNIATGGQPSSVQIDWLKNNGFNAVINLSPESTKNYLSNEAELVRQEGMNYFHYPVDCSSLAPDQYEGFRDILEGVKGSKVFVHCGMNVKSSAFVHLYRVRELGVAPESSLESIDELGFHEKKWYDYFDAMGALPEKSEKKVS